MSEKMFETAVKNKLRYPFKGLISTEDLFDLSPRDLDSIFKSLNSQVKKVQEESLLDTKTKEDETLNTMIEIVRYIVGIKLAEENARLRAKEQREKKQKIMEIMAAKQNADLESKSIEDLQTMLNDLG
jgi:hypothetical protein